MAFVDLRDELPCSTCRTTYSDPVTLRCGHNFCRVCFDHVQDTQDESGVYSCPECREELQERPARVRNMNPQNIAERVAPTESRQEEVTRICCTYCFNSVPAVRSCLLCEAFLCDKHLSVHSKGAEHVLTEPSINLEKRKCSVHKEVLKYYCTEDNTCICVSCSLAGNHRGHLVETLDEASEKIKQKLRDFKETLTTEREKTDKRVQNLEEQWRNANKKTADETERVTVLFVDIKSRLDDLKESILSDISKQEEQVSLSLSELIRKLEIKKDELSKKMSHIEELCTIKDPLTVLQDLDTGDFSNPEDKGDDGDRGENNKTHYVDTDAIAEKLYAGFSAIMSYLQTILLTKPGKKRKHHHRDQSPPSHAQDLPVSGTEYEDDNEIVRMEDVEEKETASEEEEIYGQGPADILLDIDTAANTIRISDDLKTASRAITKRSRSDTPERFQYHQVISNGSFSSGRHYWDVKIIDSGLWMVGMCYPSMDRRGNQSYIGDNDKSWCLWGGQWSNNEYSVRHDSKKISLRQSISSNRFRISLDYEAGKLSFYELCKPVKHLHTITTTFIEPLHAALYVYDGSIKILGGAVAGTSKGT